MGEIKKQRVRKKKKEEREREREFGLSEGRVRFSCSVTFIFHFF